MSERKYSLPPIDSRKLLTLNTDAIIEANATGRMPDGRRRITSGRLSQAVAEMETTIRHLPRYQPKKRN